MEVAQKLHVDARGHQQEAAAFYQELQLLRKYC